MYWKKVRDYKNGRFLTYFRFFFTSNSYFKLLVSSAKWIPPHCQAPVSLPHCPAHLLFPLYLLLPAPSNARSHVLALPFLVFVFLFLVLLSPSRCHLVCMSISVPVAPSLSVSLRSIFLSFLLFLFLGAKEFGFQEIFKNIPPNSEINLMRWCCVFLCLLLFSVPLLLLLQFLPRFTKRKIP